jgi:hypothetical protein
VFVPSTRDGKLFTIFYAIFGFCLLGVTMGKTMALIESTCRFWIRGCCTKSKRFERFRKRGKGGGGDEISAVELSAAELPVVKFDLVDSSVQSVNRMVQISTEPSQEEHTAAVLVQRTIRVRIH